MKKTKIVCTIGPACNSLETLKEMIKAGMNVARLNFSHGNYEDHEKTYCLLRKASKELGKEIAILQDLQGPKIRVGSFSGKVFELKENNIIEFNSDNKIDIKKNIIPLPHPEIIKDIKIEEKILLDDGLIEVEVIEKNNDSVKCKVIRGGILKEKKGVNLPHTNLKLPALTKKDEKDLLFGIDLGVDLVALSFVRDVEDIKRVEDIIISKNKKIPIIAKIEKPQAVDNIKSILKRCYGIMIARGDLGVELPFSKAPLIQKKLIKLANESAKPVITATQMLESMKENAVPTRAETTDVANSILDGTDAVMLSAESATGKYPIEAVNTMSKIAKEIEDNFSYEKWTKTVHITEKYSTSHALSHAACMISERIRAKAIFAHTMSGMTALRIAKFKPRCPIISLSPNIQTIRNLSLSFGIYGNVIEKHSSSEELYKYIEENCHKFIKDLKKGDHIVVTAGIPFSDMQKTNIIRIITKD